jgi:hypothetical protein
MRHIPSLLISLFIAILLMIPYSSFSQRGMKGQGRNHGWNTGTQYNRLYDKNKVVTISGDVSAVDTLPPEKGMRGGIHIMLKGEKETVSVHLGPSWFLEKQKLKVAAGDKITVTGSRITYQDKPAIIAAEVKKGDELLKLRDDNGRPLWSRGK